MGLGKVHVDAAQLSELRVAGHLASLVPGEGAAQRFRDPIADFDERGEGLGRAGGAVGRLGEPQVPAGPVKDRRDRGAVVGAGDEITLEVADLHSFIGDRRSQPDEVERTQRTWLRRRRGPFRQALFAAPTPTVQAGLL